MDPAGIVESFGRALEGVPIGVLALVLLGGPTMCLIVYRFVTSKRASRWTSGQPDLYWLCVGCNSINREIDQACYRCRVVRGAAVRGAGLSARPQPPPIPMATPVRSDPRTARPTAEVALAPAPDTAIGTQVMSDAPESVGVPVMADSDEAIEVPVMVEPVATESVPVIAEPAARPTTRTRASSKAATIPKPAPTPTDRASADADGVPPTPSRRPMRRAQSG